MTSCSSPCSTSRSRRRASSLPAGFPVGSIRRARIRPGFGSNARHTPMLQSWQRTTLRAALLFLLAITDIAAPPASAQHVGDVSLTTTTQILANTVTCTGNPQNFPVSNLGQSFHLATATTTTPGSFVMEVDGTDALANVFKI